MSHQLVPSHPDAYSESDGKLPDSTLQGEKLLSDEEPRRLGAGEIGEETHRALEDIHLAGQEGLEERLSGGRGEEGERGMFLEGDRWRYQLREGATVWDYVKHPLLSLMYYLYKLSVAFSWKFVFILCTAYGINQGMGEEWSGFAAKFYMADHLHLSPARAAAARGLSLVPWQLKAIYGMISDVVPIMGYHKTGYMLIAGSCGVLAFFILFALDLSFVPGILVFIVAHFSMASPDVMIDAAVAEKAKSHPQFAPDLQSLCWGSLGLGGFFAAATVGYMQESIGSRGIFGVCILTGVAILVPAALGFLREKRRDPSTIKPICLSCKQGLSDPLGKWVFYVAIIVTFVSVFLGFFAVFNESEHSVIINGSVTVFCAICIIFPSLLYCLSRISLVLAKASSFIFLRGAIQPSTTVLFYWYRKTRSNCERGYPCLDPGFLGWMDVAGYAFLFVGTIIYQKYFASWSYRSIFIFAQVLLVFVNLMDLIWVTRLNVKIGISDKVFLLGEEVLGPIVRRLSEMPMLILAAKLCPSGVEATLFALNMGLSNFGVSIGDYLGQALLGILGGVNPPDFNNLAVFILVLSNTQQYIKTNNSICERANMDRYIHLYVYMCVHTIRYTYVHVCRCLCFTVKCWLNVMFILLICYMYVFMYVCM
ncbi:hypothetical protein AAMO2058_001432700 [Amorphochlora amoebiformis]